MSSPDLAGRGLAEVKAILDSSGIRFILEGGALLGAVREGDFLPWDDDVDVAVRCEDLAPRAVEIAEPLAAAGFAAKVLDASPGACKISAQKHGIDYQICGWHLRGRWRRRRHHRMPPAFFEKTTTVDLRGVTYPCPDPPTRYLEFCYGDWRTPRRGGRAFSYRCYDLKYLAAKRIRRILRIGQRKG